MIYAMVIGGVLAAGLIPAVAYGTYRAAKQREREKLSRSSRRKKLEL